MSNVRLLVPAPVPLFETNHWVQTHTIGGVTFGQTPQTDPYFYIETMLADGTTFKMQMNKSTPQFHKGMVQLMLKILNIQQLKQQLETVQKVVLIDDPSLGHNFSRLCDGEQLVFLWYSYGIPMVFLWYSYLKRTISPYHPYPRASPIGTEW